MTSTKLGDNFLRIPKLDVSRNNWVIYKDRLLWSVDARGLLHHLDGSKAEPVDPIPDRKVSSQLTEDEAKLDAEWKKATKVWRQGEAIVKQQIAGIIPDSVFMKV